MKTKGSSFLALALIILTGLCLQTAAVQFPKLPKIPRAKPTPTPESQPAAAPAPSPAPGGGAQPQPSATTPAAPAPQAAPGETTLVLTRIQFWPKTITSYQGEYNDVWSWVPRVKFSTQGPGLPSGARYYVEVGQPGGAAWMKIKCGEPSGSGVECEADSDQEKSSTLATGVFPFTVTVRNPLEGTEKKIFTGRAKVEKTLSSEVGPKSVRKFVYYSNQDWNLPIGQVYINDEGHPAVRFWIRGEPDGLPQEAHLLYRGEEVGLFEKYGQRYGAARCSTDMEYRPTRDTGPAAPQGAKWARLNCPFETVAAKPNPDVPEWHILSANPGEYEVVVLLNKKRARVMKFAIGPDGKIVDNRIASGNGMAWDNFIFVPVQIIGEQDGVWDKTAWKTEAFYGHPLNGFNWTPQ